MRLDTPNVCVSRSKMQPRLHHARSWSGLCTQDSRTRCLPMFLSFLLRMRPPPPPPPTPPKYRSLPLLLLLFLHLLLLLLLNLLLLPLPMRLMLKDKMLHQHLQLSLTTFLLHSPPIMVNHPHLGKSSQRYSLNTRMKPLVNEE